MKTNVRDGEIVFIVMLIIVLVSSIGLYYWQNKQVIALTRDQHEIGDGCLSTEFATGKRALAGQIISYFTIPLYPLSLISQLWSNFKNKTVEGISPVMFTCTVFGNILYGLSILLDGIMNNRMLQQFPYVLNALIPGILDIFIVIQYAYYSRKQNKKDQEQKDNEVKKAARESYIGRQSVAFNPQDIEKLLEKELDFGCQVGEPDQSLTANLTDDHSKLTIDSVVNKDKIVVANE